MNWFGKNSLVVKPVLTALVMILSGCGPGHESLDDQSNEQQMKQQQREEVFNQYEQGNGCQEQAQSCRESCFGQDDIQALHQEVGTCQQGFADCIDQQGHLLVCGQEFVDCTEDISIEAQAMQFADCMQGCAQGLGNCLCDLDSFTGLEELDDLHNTHKQCFEQSTACLQPCQTDLEGCMQSLDPGLEQLTACIKESASELMDCIGQTATDWIWVDALWAAEQLQEAGQTAAEVALFLVEKLGSSATIALDIIRALYNMSLHDAMTIIVDTGLASVQWAAETLMEAGQTAAEVARFIVEKLKQSVDVALDIVRALYNMSLHDAVTIMVDAGLASAQWAVEMLKEAGQTAVQIARLLVEKLKFSVDGALDIIRALYNLSLHDAVTMMVEAGLAGMEWAAGVLKGAGQAAVQVATFLVERLKCSAEAALDIIRALYNMSLHDAVTMMVEAGLAGMEWAAGILKGAGQAAVQVAKFLVEKLKCSVEAALDIIKILYNISLHDAVTILVEAGLAGAQWAAGILRGAGQAAGQVATFLVEKLKCSVELALDIIKTLYNISLHDAVKIMVDAGLAGAKWAVQTLRNLGAGISDCLKLLINKLGINDLPSLRDILRDFFNLSEVCEAIVDWFGLGPIAKHLCRAGDHF